MSTRTYTVQTKINKPVPIVFDAIVQADHLSDLSQMNVISEHGMETKG